MSKSVSLPVVITNGPPGSPSSGATTVVQPAVVSTTIKVATPHVVSGSGTR